MADLDGIADLLSTGIKGPQGPDDSGYHTGIIRSWNNLTGANTVEINGVLLSNLRTLRAGITSQYNIGETVVVLRKQTQYFIMGRVAAVAAGGCSGIQSASNSNSVNYKQNLTPFYPASGVTVQAYLSSSCRALVIVKVKVTVYTYTDVSVGIQYKFSNGVTVPIGFVAPDAIDEMAFATSPSTGDSVDGSINLLYMAKPEDGFLPGLTEFKTMCVVGDGSTGATGVDIHQCNMVVIPL